MRIDAGDVAAVVFTISVLETIKWLFGPGIALAVAVTAETALLVFLYHAGKAA